MIPVISIGDDQCSEGMFRCENGGACIPDTFRCDGINDCDPLADARVGIMTVILLFGHVTRHKVVVTAINSHKVS